MKHPISSPGPFLHLTLILHLPLWTWGTYLLDDLAHLHFLNAHRVFLIQTQNYRVKKQTTALVSMGLLLTVWPVSSRMTAGSQWEVWAPRMNIPEAYFTWQNDTLIALLTAAISLGHHYRRFRRTGHGYMSQSSLQCPLCNLKIQI